MMCRFKISDSLEKRILFIYEGLILDVGASLICAGAKLDFG